MNLNKEVKDETLTIKYKDGKTSTITFRSYDRGGNEYPDVVENKIVGLLAGKNLLEIE